MWGEYAKCGSPISIRSFVVKYSTRSVLEQRNRARLSAIFEKNRFKVYRVTFVSTFVSTVFENRGVAQGLKRLATTLETRVRFPLVF